MANDEETFAGCALLDEIASRQDGCQKRLGENKSTQDATQPDVSINTTKDKVQDISAFTTIWWARGGQKRGTEYCSFSLSTVSAAFSVHREVVSKPYKTGFPAKAL